MKDAARRRPATSTCARFECLGACDIAPMASVNGEYVGPLEPRTAERDRRRRQGRPRRCCRTSSSRKRPAASKHWRTADDREHRHDPLQGHRRARASTRSTSTQRRGGYEMLRKALKMEPRRGARRDARLRRARPRRRRLRDGQKMSFIPKGTMDKYLVCNADESEPGTFKDRELMQKNPHLLIEGIIIGAYCDRRQQARSSSSAASTTTSGRHPRRGASPRRARRATSARTSSAPTTRSTWSCTAAPAPTSAARRPRCWTRSRASAATRA